MRAHTQNVGLNPGWGAYRRQPINLSLSLSPRPDENGSSDEDEKEKKNAPLEQKQYLL